tara:strand:- start:69 stop:542 length:474 start_codon:yes stop_codon:yes gene_type:complete
LSESNKFKKFRKSKFSKKTAINADSNINLKGLSKKYIIKMKKMKKVKKLVPEVERSVVIRTVKKISEELKFEFLFFKDKRNKGNKIYCSASEGSVAKNGTPLPEILSIKVSVLGIKIETALLIIDISKNCEKPTIIWKKIIKYSNFILMFCRPNFIT